MLIFSTLCKSYPASTSSLSHTLLVLNFRNFNGLVSWLFYTCYGFVSNKFEFHDLYSFSFSLNACNTISDVDDVSVPTFLYFNPLCVLNILFIQKTIPVSRSSVGKHRNHWSRNYWKVQPFRLFHYPRLSFLSVLILLGHLERQCPTTLNRWHLVLFLSSASSSLLRFVLSFRWAFLNSYWLHLFLHLLISISSVEAWEDWKFAWWSLQISRLLWTFGIKTLDKSLHFVINDISHTP